MGKGDALRLLQSAWPTASATASGSRRYCGRRGVSSGNVVPLLERFAAAGPGGNAASSSAGPGRTGCRSPPADGIVRS
jgi:hypothetical protein